jgi:hypothetical protein
VSDKYILDGHTPKPVDDLMEWARQFEKTNRRVAHTTTKTGAEVSTIFLGLDHAFGSGKPLLFETMIFGGAQDGYCDRYATWDEAEAGHVRAVQLAEAEGTDGHATDQQ